MAEFDSGAWEKKLLKIYKALRLMEKHKQTEPYFSDSFKELAIFLNENKKIAHSNGVTKDSYGGNLSHLSINDISGIFPGESIFNQKMSVAASQDSVFNKDPIHKSAFMADYDPLFIESAMSNNMKSSIGHNASATKPLMVSELIKAPEQLAHLQGTGQTGQSMQTAQFSLPDDHSGASPNSNRTNQKSFR